MRRCVANFPLGDSGRHGVGCGALTIIIVITNGIEYEDFFNKDLILEVSHWDLTISLDSRWYYYGQRMKYLLTDQLV